MTKDKNKVSELSIKLEAMLAWAVIITIILMPIVVLSIWFKSVSAGCIVGMFAWAMLGAICGDY